MQFSSRFLLPKENNEKNVVTRDRTLDFERLGGNAFKFAGASALYDWKTTGVNSPSQCRQVGLFPFNSVLH